jgi:hypothetical protein
MPTNPEVHFVEKFYYEPYYPTSTENADGLDDFYVVQNFDSRYIQIKANLNLESDVEIFMYNLEGKTVYTTHLASSSILNHSIFKDGFSKGIYFIKYHKGFDMNCHYKSNQNCLSSGSLEVSVSFDTKE